MPGFFFDCGRGKRRTNKEHCELQFVAPVSQGRRYAYGKRDLAVLLVGREQVERSSVNAASMAVPMRNCVQGSLLPAYTKINRR
jgi:hypothetical protein